MSDVPIPDDAHWHTLMMTHIGTPEFTSGYLQARPTKEEARALFADLLGAKHGGEVSACELEQFLADVRAGKRDYMSDDEFCCAVYPCTGDDDKECRAIAAVVSRSIARSKAIVKVACMCPDHVAARGGVPRMPGTVDVLGVPLTAAMFTAAFDTDPPTGMYL